MDLSAGQIEVAGQNYKCRTPVTSSDCGEDAAQQEPQAPRCTRRNHSLASTEAGLLVIKGEKTLGGSGAAS